MTNAMPSLQMTIKLSYGWRPFALPSSQSPHADRSTAIQVYLQAEDKALCKQGAFSGERPYAAWSSRTSAGVYCASAGTMPSG